MKFRPLWCLCLAAFLVSGVGPVSAETDRLQSLYESAVKAEQQGAGDEALKFWNQAYDRAEQITNPTVAQAQLMMKVAQRFQDWGYHAKAEKLFRRTLPVLEKNPRAAGGDLENNIACLAVACDTGGAAKYHDAENLYKRLTVLRESSSNAWSNRTAKLPLIQFYLSHDKLDEAKALYPVCPRCKSRENVMPIIYGEGTAVSQAWAKRGLVKTAGCVILPNSGVWYCSKPKCQAKF